MAGLSVVFNDKPLEKRCRLAGKEKRAKGSGKSGSHHFVLLLGEGWQQNLLVSEEVFNAAPDLGQVVVTYNLVPIKADCKRGAVKMESDVLELSIVGIFSANPGAGQNSPGQNPPGQSPPGR